MSVFDDVTPIKGLDGDTIKVASNTNPGTGQKYVLLKARDGLSGEMAVASVSPEAARLLAAELNGLADELEA
ncbi:hypothetical protein [Roseibium sp. RKSG952]|uniref:hypothetical protein n=1 Tax=Roseibium sp. RKSG952 TaxID=2529384 RepID=UPI0012BBFE83|nr:hypothetical protein [Roseibium sp. RKSG952]MTH96542.1 hypothetical protein [Roseibium sp. RKSG952]